MFGIFTPYGRVGERTLLYVGAAELALVLVLWAVSPIGLLPSPMEVWQQLGVQMNRGLLVELAVSMKLNLEALAIASATALVLSWAYVLPFMRPVANFVAGLRNFGTIGISFVFLVLIPDSHWVKVAVLVFAILPYLTTAMLEIVQTVEDDLFNHARTLRLGNWGTTWRVLILGQRDKAIEAIRQNASIGWMMVAMVEGMIRTEGGIGVMLMTESRYLRLADLFAILAVIYLVGALQDVSFRSIRNWIAPYAKLSNRSL